MASRPLHPGWQFTVGSLALIPTGGAPPRRLDRLGLAALVCVLWTGRRLGRGATCTGSRGRRLRRGLLGQTLIGLGFDRMVLAFVQVLPLLSLTWIAPSTVDPRHLTQWIKKTNSIDELVSLHRQHGPYFNHIHLSAAWMALGRLTSLHGSASASRSGYTRYRPMPPQVQEQLKPLMGRSARLALSGALRGRELANVIYGVARSRFPESATRSGLLEALAAVAASTRLDSMNSQELSNTAWAFATTGHHATALFEALAEVAEISIDDFNPQELSNLCWAYATAGHQAPALFDAVAAASAPALMNPQNIANTCWAFATAKHRAPALFDALADAACARITELEPQHLANMAWAYTTAQHAAPRLYDAIATAVSTRVGQFKPRELSALAFAFAEAGHQSPRLFEALAATCAVPGYALSDFKPQAVAHVAWAFATTGHRSPVLFDAMATAAVPQVADFQPWALAQAAWGYAAAQHRAPRLVGALADVAATLARDEPRAFTPAELAKCVWAFATAEATPLPSLELFGALTAAATPVVNEMDAESLGQLWCGMATARYAPPPLLEALTQRTIALAGELGASESAEVAWASALVGTNDGSPPAALLDALAASALHHLEALTLAELGKLAGALALASHPAPSLEAALAARCAEAGAWPKRLPRTPLAQLHAWRLWHAERGQPSPLPSALTERCRAAAEACHLEELSGLTASSHGQAIRARTSVPAWPSGSSSLALAEALKALGCSPRRRVPTALGLTLDMLVDWKGRSVGVVVESRSDRIHVPYIEATAATEHEQQQQTEGAQRQTSSAPGCEEQLPTGAAMLRRRLLNALLPIVVVDAEVLIEADELVRSLDDAINHVPQPWAAAMAAERAAALKAERVATPEPEDIERLGDKAIDVALAPTVVEQAQTARTVPKPKAQKMAMAKDMALASAGPDGARVTTMNWAQFRASKKGEKLTMAELGSLWQRYKEDNRIG